MQNYIRPGLRNGAGGRFYESRELLKLGVAHGREHFHLQSAVFIFHSPQFGWRRPRHSEALAITQLFEPLFFIADLAFSALGRGFAKGVTLGGILCRCQL